MELATALHHSAQRVEAPREGVEGETNDAPRRPKPPLPGKRPGVLLDPEPVQVVDAVTSYVAAPGPSSLVPRLAANDALDNATLKFLVARALLDRREQEEERRKREEEVKKRKKALLERLTAEGRRELEERLDSGGASSKRKRKKRRKRRTPRTSSLPSRARRRQRQWSACSAGFTGDDIPCVMFPSGVARPKMLDIMAGLVQMDSYIGIARLVLLVTLHLPLCFLHCLQARPVWTRRNVTFRRAENCGCPQSQFLAGRRFPVAVQRPIPMVLLFSRP